MPIGGGASSGAVRAGGAFVELFTKDTLLEKGLKATERKVAAFGATMQKIGAVALTAGVGVLSAAGFGAIRSLNETADLAATAKAFGLTAEEASRTFGVMKSGGSDLRDATEGLVTLGQRVDEALSGKDEVAAELFQKLGVSADQFFGLNPAEQFNKMMVAIRGVENPADRVTLLMKAFGEDTGKNLLKLLAKTPDELDRLGKSFELSAADMERAEKASAAYHQAVAALDGVWQKVSVALAPTLTMIADRVTAAAKMVGEFVDHNRELVVGGFAAAAAVAAFGAAFVGVGTALSLGATALGGFATAVGAVLSPVGLVAAAVVGLSAGLGYLYATQTTEGQQVAAAMGDTFTDLKDAAVTAFGGITAALGAGDFETAGEIAMAGLDVAWTAGLNALQEAWTGFKGFFVDGFHDATKLISLAFVDLFAGLRGQLGGYITTLHEAFEKLPGFAKSVLDPTGLGREALGAAADVVNGDPDAIRNQIEADAAREQAERDRSRAAALSVTRQAVEAAKQHLQELADAAVYDEEEEEPPKKKQLRTQMAGMAKATGAFLGGADATQVFGQGINVQQKQLDAAKKQVDLLEDQNDKLDDIKDAIRNAQGVCFT